MTLDWTDPRLADAAAKLEPYARSLLSEAGACALRLHAETVTADHLLVAAMSDPDCAAYEAVVHAFADPATIAHEALATAPGVMVVASDSIRAFSTRGLSALVRARERAVRGEAHDVTEHDLLRHAFEELDEVDRAALREAGFAGESTSGAPRASADPELTEKDALFKHFSPSARKSLSAANRIAAAFGTESIGPAALFLGALKIAEGGSDSIGIGYRRAERLLAGHAADDLPPPPRALPADAGLVRFLARLAAPATSLELLECYFSGETSELAQVLQRHKVTPALVNRSRGAFFDPPGASAARESR